MKISSPSCRFMSPTILGIFSCLLLLSCSVLAWAESPQETATRLQNRYDSLHSLSFDFIQDTRGQLAGRPKRGSGQAFFVKTGKGTNKTAKMRWNYQAPDKQVLLSDGNNFFMYFASLHQMIVTPAKALDQDLTFSFFTGAGNILEDFIVSEPDANHTSQDGASIIKLVPQTRQSQIAAIHLWVTPESLIRRIEILDHFDTLTVLNFSNLKINDIDQSDSALMKQLFQFIPPNGTEIINR